MNLTRKAQLLESMLEDVEREIVIAQVELGALYSKRLDIKKQREAALAGQNFIMTMGEQDAS